MNPSNRPGEQPSCYMIQSSYTVRAAIKCRNTSYTNNRNTTSIYNFFIKRAAGLFPCKLLESMKVMYSMNECHIMEERAPLVSLNFDHNAQT